jgi:hypothetical protein
MTAMRTSRDERRARIRAEQEKVVPGSGLGVRLDRGLWSFGGAQRAGEWNWLYALFGLVTFALASLVLQTSSEGVAGGLIALCLLAARGYWLHLRYRRRAGAR